NTIRGDGDIVTHTISIDDYSEMIIEGGRIEINYTQAMSDEKAPFLEVSTDRNIFEKYDFEVVNGKTLRVCPKQEYRRNTNFKPTRFIVNTNSTRIEKATLTGSSELNTEHTITTDRLYIDVAGSGKINLRDTIRTKSFESSIAGSGNMQINYLETLDFKGTIAGSGSLSIAGKGSNGELSIAGAGEVSAFDFVLDNASANIAGAGSVELTANKHLEASIAGAGDISYKGDPEIKKDIAGVGKIRKAD
ncbi:DUF2807 domain-containing protein, partial [Parabacteroides sp. OttesenSCG-928-G21]|nr:DUF2807 domain-containing protein [Parabacteroides sp. OttesenSCG-928-G21]